MFEIYISLQFLNFLKTIGILKYQNFRQNILSVGVLNIFSKLPKNQWKTTCARNSQHFSFVVISIIGCKCGNVQQFETSVYNFGIFNYYQNFQQGLNAKSFMVLQKSFYGIVFYFILILIFLHQVQAFCQNGGNNSLYSFVYHWHQRACSSIKFGFV